MTSSSKKIFLSLHWLCLLVILGVSTSSSHGLGRLCGQSLSNALDLICQQGFAAKIKKSLEPEDYYLDMEAEAGPSDISEFPFFSKLAGSLLSKTRRSRHALTHECCDKPCTMSELALYCR